MHTLLIVALACASLGLISADIPSTVIEADLADVTRLSQDFQRLSPAIGQQFNDASCQMITQCCPQLQSTFASLALSGKGEAIMEQCFGRKDSSTFMSKLQSCPPFTTMTSLMKNPQFTKYATLMSKKATQNKDDMQLVMSSCSPDEIFAMACEPSRTDLQKTCQRKALQLLARRGDQEYRSKVDQLKSGYTQLANELRNGL